MKTPSIGRNTYFLTFIDDFSRKTWIYFLKHKSNAFGCFQQFKSLVEKKSGYYIKVLRIDRGGEYVSREFMNFCKVYGIHKQFTARYTPQQNGVTKRKNQTIMEMVRIMLETKHLSNEYWDDGLAIVVYIINRCLTKSVKNKVPQESWTSMKHNVVHLKVFGSFAYAHVPYELRKKLDKKGQKHVFVGYYEDTKEYKLYDPIARKFIINHDVQFVENEAWDGSIERTIKIIDAMRHDDMEDEVVQTPIVIKSAVLSTMDGFRG
jgi:hypothetical protein